MKLNNKISNSKLKKKMIKNLKILKIILKQLFNVIKNLNFDFYY
jgi:hypothetical protein